MRLERTALFAHENGFKVFATTNGVSRWKDLQQVNASGRKAANLFPGLSFWDRNWREKDAHKLMKQVSERDNFYQQTYCGCEYSIQSTAKIKAAT